MVFFSFFGFTKIGINQESDWLSNCGLILPKKYLSATSTTTQKNNTPQLQRNSDLITEPLPHSGIKYDRSLFLTKTLVKKEIQRTQNIAPLEISFEPSVITAPTPTMMKQNTKDGKLSEVLNANDLIAFLGG